MIRLGMHEDVNQGADLLKEYVKEFDWAQSIEEDNTEYYINLMNSIATDKTAVVSINDNKIDGVLLGMRTPNILNPHQTQLQILVTWVHPDKRGGSIFYRMHKFLEKEIVKNNEEVIIYSLPTTNINHEKLGYKVLQTVLTKVH